MRARLVLLLFLAIFSRGPLANAMDVYHTADEFFSERRDPAHARAALEQFRVLHARARSADSAWRLAMATYFVGLRLTTDVREQKNLFAEGRDAAYGAVQASPKSAACHFWGAVNAVLYGERLGRLKLLFQLDDIRAHLAASAAIDPAYAFGGAYRTLGLIDQKLPRIFGGSAERARDYFRRAIAVAPNEPLNYAALAEVLAGDLDAPGAALQAAQAALARPMPGPERVESREALAVLQKNLRNFEAKSAHAPPPGPVAHM